MSEALQVLEPGDDDLTVPTTQQHVAAYHPGNLASELIQVPEGNIMTNCFSINDGSASEQEMDYTSDAYRSLADAAKSELARILDLHDPNRDILVQEKRDETGQRWWFLMTVRPMLPLRRPKPRKANKIAQDRALDI